MNLLPQVRTKLIGAHLSCHYSLTKKVRDKCSFALGIVAGLTTKEACTIGNSSMVECAPDNYVVVLGM